MNFTLLTNAYAVGVSERRLGELCQALHMNLQNGVVTGILAIIEDEKEAFRQETASDARARKLGELLQHPKVTKVWHGHRATMAELFGYANQLRAGSIVGIANADIGFDGSLRALDGVDWKDVFLAVSRRDVWRPSASQDAWIFQTPLPQSFESAHDWGWTLGKAGTDNKNAFEAARAGYRVVNPCLALELRHFHGSHERTYNREDALPQPHGFVFPTDMRPVLAARPRGTKAVVTTCSEDLLAAKTIPRMVRYAERCGAEFVAIPDGPGTQMLDVFSRHERVVYLEPEVLVLEEAPNLFEEIKPRQMPAREISAILPGGVLAMLDDHDHTGRWTPQRVVEKYERYGYGRADLWGGVNWSAAVVVADIHHAWLFGPPPEVFWRRPGIIPPEPPEGAVHRDAAYLSAIIRKVEADVQGLRPEQNYMTFLARKGRPNAPLQFLNPEGGTSEMKQKVIDEALSLST